MSHVFGPVPSRRLGASLGIDLVPYKTCSFDCVYCQLGRTTCLTVERRAYIDAADVLSELEDFISKNEAPDYLTLSGSGEPTLNSSFGEVIRGIKNFSQVPIAVLTNTSLLWRKEVQTDIVGSDLVVPSLDAGSQLVFELVNRPHSSLTLDRVVDGLRDFSTSFEGDIWLEVMLVSGMNDGEDELELISDAISEIDPQKVQLNTVIRPPSESYARPISEDKIGEISRMLGAEIIADYKSRRRGVSRDLEERLLSLLERRPCTLADISGAMGIHPNEAIKYLEKLIDSGKVRAQDSGSGTFYLHGSS